MLDDNKRVTLWIVEDEDPSKDADIRPLSLSAPHSVLACSGPKLESMIARIPEDGVQTIRFEGTNHEASKLFLYWLLNHRLPESADMTVSLLLNSWVLGEKLELYDFLDDIMVHLMREIDARKMEVTVESLRDVFCIEYLPSTAITEASNLEILFCEEAVRTKIMTSENDISKYGLDKCNKNHENCGLYELPAALAKAVEQYKDDRRQIENRFDYREPGKAAPWLYLLNGPRWTYVRELVELGLQGLWIGL